MPYRTMFANLPDPLGSALEIASYLPKETIFEEGQAARTLYVVINGRAKLTIAEPNGRSVVLRFVESGETLGLSSVVAGTPYPATARVVSPAQIGQISAALFKAVERRSSDLALWSAAQLAEELHAAWAQMRSLALARSTRAKLAYLLLSLGRGNRVSVPLTVTQDEMAASIGSTRETVNRAIAQFRRSGWLRTASGSLLLLQPRRLRALIAGE